MKHAHTLNIMSTKIPSYMEAKLSWCTCSKQDIASIYSDLKKFDANVSILYSTTTSNTFENIYRLKRDTYALIWITDGAVLLAVPVARPQTNPALLSRELKEIARNVFAKKSPPLWSHTAHWLRQCITARRHKVKVLNMTFYSGSNRNLYAFCSLQATSETGFIDLRPAERRGFLIRVVISFLVAILKGNPL
jgi:hypothetical protein